MDIADTRRDIQNLPDVLPVMFDKAAAVPMTLPVGVEMGSQVWTGRDMEMGDPDVGRDIRVLTDMCPMMIDELSTGLLSLPVVVNTETQVDVRWEATLAVVPFAVGCGRPAGWLDSESDCCVMYLLISDHFYFRTSYVSSRPKVTRRSVSRDLFALIVLR